MFTGRGVVSLVPIPKGKLVLIYEGKITEEEPKGSDTYVFEVCHNRQKHWCVNVTLSCIPVIGVANA